MSATAAPRLGNEHLRLLALMGVDVYVPRDAPLARATPPGATGSRDTSAIREDRAPVVSGGARLIVRGVRHDEHPQLLASLLRAARLRNGDWTFDASGSARLPEWRFGNDAEDASAGAAMAFPPLAELRNSVAARRAAWHQLRAWLRGP